MMLMFFENARTVFRYSREEENQPTKLYEQELHVFLDSWLIIVE